MLLPSSLASAISDEWETTLKAERARILSSLQTKIPDQSAFQDKVADASSDEYASFLVTVGGKWDADLIETKQRVKLSTRYSVWKSGIDTAFAPSGTFETNVTAKKAKLAELRRVIGVVGHKSLGTWNPAVMATLLLRGDTRVTRYFDANDSFSGTLEACLDPRLGALMSPTLIAEMVQACVLAKYANEGGLTAIRDSIISNSNSRLATILAACVDAQHDGDPYTVSLVLAWSAPADNLTVTVLDTS
jgi:hypothetical protein